MKHLANSPPDHETRLAVAPDIDPAEILAEHWNERLPPKDNIETITWWIRQASDGDTTG